MAANSKAIGLLFEVAGGGNISGETGARINGQLRQIVGQINKSDTVRLKFTIDANHLRSEIEALKKQLQSLTTGQGGTSGQGSGVNTQAKAYRNATAAMDNYYRLQTQVNQAMTRTNEITMNADGTLSTTSARWQDLVVQTNQAKIAYDAARSSAALTAEQQEDLATRASQAQARMAIQIKTFEANAQIAWGNLTAKVNDYIARVEYSASRNPEAARQLNELRTMANSTDWRGYDALKQKLAEVQRYINQNELATEKWYQKMAKTFGTRIRSLLSGLLLAKVIQSVRQLYTNVVEIDSAMTQLKIITGATESQMERFLTNSTRFAKELGSTIKDVLASVETFSRLGYNIEDASLLAKYATILSKVADVTSEEATTGLTSIIKGYGFDPSNSEHIADVLIQVGQKYAVSASELMEAYSKTGAALNATNTSFEKSAGLIAAANASVQNASIVGTALKTVSARIRKSKTDLDDLGESADDLTEAFSVYADEIQKMTGFNIRVEGTTDTYKDLFDIFDGIAQKWNELSDTQQARIAEILGGTRQFQVIASILTNWKDAANAYKDAIDSAGVSTKAMAIYTDSIEGRIGKLKATFEDFSKTILSSGVVKTIVSLLSGLLQGLTKVFSSGNEFALKITALAVGLGVLMAAMVKVRLAAIGLATSLFNLQTGGVVALISAIPKLVVGILSLATASGRAAVKTLGLKGALEALNINPYMLALSTAIVVVGILATTITKASRAAADASKKAKEQAESMKEIANKAKEESDSIDELISRYQELKSAGALDADTRKEIRDIQKQINVLTHGEGSSLDLVNGKLDDQLAKLRQIRAIKNDDSIKKYKTAFASAVSSANTAYEDSVDANWFLSTVNSISGWFDQGGQLVIPVADEKAKRLLLNASPEGLQNIGTVNEYYGQMTSLDFNAKGASEYIKAITNVMDVLEDPSNTYDYLNSPLYTALAEFKSTYESYLDPVVEARDQLLDAVVQKYGLEAEAQDKLVGYDIDTEQRLEGRRNALIGLIERSSELQGLVDNNFLTIDDIMHAVDDFMQQNYADKYNQFVDTAIVDTKSVAQILGEIQGPFDSLVDAMSDMDEYGIVTAKTFTSMMKDYPDLINYLTQTENGYILNADALVKYTEALIETYTAEAALKTMTAESRDVAIQNLKNLQTALAMLSASSTKVKSSSDSRKSALNDEKDTLKDQLDAYKELIDLRKKLLEQYEEELEYKKELEEKEKKVSSLQARHTVSLLDTTAAGRAKTRQLAKELAEAQEDLEDFTLEHAIDVITGELDNQYEEYKKFIDDKLDNIEKAIDSLSASNSGSASGVSASVAAAAAAASDKIAAAIALLEVAPVVEVDVAVTVDGSDQAEANKMRAIDYLKSHGVTSSNYLEKSKSDRNIGSIIQTYGLDIFDYLEHKYSKGVSAGGSHSGGGMRFHSGGIVGDSAHLKSTEVFAKLLKGEFVATPAMMERFMNQTLPNIAGSSGGNEFNAPLISIQCESVTQESLPKLKDVVNDAVQEIKRQLDSGMSRTGYRKSVNKIV